MWTLWWKMVWFTSSKQHCLKLWFKMVQECNTPDTYIRKCENGHKSPCFHALPSLIKFTQYSFSFISLFSFKRLFKVPLHSFKMILRTWCKYLYVNLQDNKIMMILEVVNFVNIFWWNKIIIITMMMLYNDVFNVFKL